MANSSESVNFVKAILVDPCPLPWNPFCTKSMIQVLGTVAGVSFSPCGLPGKMVGGLIGYACGSIIASKIFK